MESYPKTERILLMQLKEYEKEFYSQPNFDFEKSTKRIERVLELIGKNKLVLDVGCWGGEISEVIQKKGNKVTAIDISEESVKKAKEKGINAFVCDITEGINFNEKSFDVAYMGDILEHLFDVKRALQEARRVLKDNGKLIITTINVCSLRDRILVLFGHLPAYYGTHEDHIRLFNKKKIVKLLKESGFQITKFEGLQIELPYWKGGKMLVFDTKRFATLSSQFIIEALKRSDNNAESGRR